MFNVVNISILTDEKPSRVAFGSTLDREVFPTHVPHTRFGNDLSPIRGAPQRGPGCYNNEEVSSNRDVLFLDAPLY